MAQIHPCGQKIQGWRRASPAATPPPGEALPRQLGFLLVKHSLESSPYPRIVTVCTFQTAFLLLCSACGDTVGPLAVASVLCVSLHAQATRPLALLRPGPTRKSDLDAKIGSFWAKRPKVSEGTRSVHPWVHPYSSACHCMCMSNHVKHIIDTHQQQLCGRCRTRALRLLGWWLSRTDVRPRLLNGPRAPPPQATCL